MLGPEARLVLELGPDPRPSTAEWLLLLQPPEGGTGDVLKLRPGESRTLGGIVPGSYRVALYERDWHEIPDLSREARLEAGRTARLHFSIP